MVAMLDDNDPLVRRARADARQFFAKYPHPDGLVYDHTYGDVRVRVTRAGRVRVFDAKRHPLSDPIWDSDNPTPRRRRLRSRSLRVFDAKGHPLGDPIWDSDNP